MALDTLADDYARLGYLPRQPILSAETAREHRAAFEAAEARMGALHYKAKMHTVMRHARTLATHRRVLDIVEAIIGPDILLYDSTYIVKEPRTPSFVSWHQDLAFWGLTENAGPGQVTLWLALSPATAESGCMRMIPGSHAMGRMHHETKADPTNVLFQAQTVHGVDEGEAVMCPLAPGEASFHHGWTLHASMPNGSDDRRIGFNAQYLSPSVRQTKHDLDTAILVRGDDGYGHFGKDTLAEADWSADAVARWRALDELHVATQGTA